jgi:hypothetical protein
LATSLSPPNQPTFEEKIEMATVTKNASDFFYGAFAAAAMIGPILLVIAASKMPEGLETGEFIVYGHGVLLAVLSTALVLRAAYAFGFSKALKIGTAVPNYTVTAWAQGSVPSQQG